MSPPCKWYPEVVAQCNCLQLARFIESDPVVLFRGLPRRIVFCGKAAERLPPPGKPVQPSEGPHTYETEEFHVGCACFARIAVYHAVKHYERRLAARLAQETQCGPKNLYQDDQAQHQLNGLLQLCISDLVLLYVH